MPVTASIPSTDESNPFYCPSVSAGAYIKALRSKLESLSDKSKPQRVYKNADLFVSYARRMDNFLRDLEHQATSSMRKRAFSGSGVASDSHQHLAPAATEFASETALGFSQGGSPAAFGHPSPPTSPSGPYMRFGEPSHLEATTNATGFFRPDVESTFVHRISDSSQDCDTLLSLVASHEHEFCDADDPTMRCSQDDGSATSMHLGSAPRCAQSSLSNSEVSFEVEVRRQRLRYPPLEHGIDSGGPLADIETAHDLPGGWIADWATMSHLAERLDAIFPGIRLYERLCGLPSFEPEAYLLFLASKGLINAQSLECFAQFRVTRFIYQPTEDGVPGLELLGKNAFACAEPLITLVSMVANVECSIKIQGTRLEPSDVFCFAHLPNLTALSVKATGLNNESIFMLVSLKATLKTLEIDENSALDDDIIPVFIILERLTFLGIEGTSIGMGGLRRLGKTFFYGDRHLVASLPRACRTYLKEANEEAYYLLYPQRPLIRDPQECAQLDEEALKANLEAHAACNAGITVSGTRLAMAERLRVILTRRREDMLVKRLADQELHDAMDE